MFTFRGVGFKANLDFLFCLNASLSQEVHFSQVLSIWSRYQAGLWYLLGWIPRSSNIWCRCSSTGLFTGEGGLIDRRMEGWVDGRINGWIDGWTGEWMDGWSHLSAWSGGLTPP